MKLQDLCRRADLAIRLGSLDYAIAVCRQLLQAFPGLIQARCLHAQALLDKGLLDQAEAEFSALLELDPENPLAHSGLGVVGLRQGDLERAIERFERALALRPGDAVVRDSLLQLRAERKGSLPHVEPPASRLSVAGWRLRRQEYDLALRECDWLVANEPERAEVLLLRAEVLWRSDRDPEAEQACQQILQRWPRCLKARLIMGEILSRDPGREARGVTLLHDAFGADPGGAIASLLFRDSYFELPRLADEVDLPPNGSAAPTPPEIESALALLPRLGPVESGDSDWVPAAGTDLEPPPPSATKMAKRAAPQSRAAPSKEVAEVTAELERMVDEMVRPRRAEPSTLSAGQGSHLVVTSRRRLLQKYGQAGVGRVEEKIGAYLSAVEATGLDGALVYVDEASSLSPYGLSPISANEPSQIKALLDRLDDTITDRGGDLSSVLILGGDSVVPFYHLENPAEDDDEEVLSDSPYASRDDDYLLPERSLGRLPDSSDGDLQFLLKQIDTAILRRNEALPGVGAAGCLGSLLSLGGLSRLVRTSEYSFGYSARVWKEASETVISVIGEPSSLQLCPPITLRDVEASWPVQCRLGYFNLHGTKDTPHWYGQKDSTFPSDYPMLPVALSPDVLGRVNVAGSIVFSEACYGAYIQDKTPKTSLALRFLDEGALAVVGSTVIAYGSASSSLSAADLLGLRFWENVLAGMPLGEALAQAKHSFFQDTVKRQGWLDGDDQKTLLQFVLYGDPSIRLETGRRLQHTVVKRLDRVSVPHSAICKRFRSAHARHDLSPETVQRVVRHLQTQAPDAWGHSFRIVRQGGCQGQCDDCPSGLPKSMRSASPPKALWSFTTQRSVPASDGARLRRYARVTLDAEGNIIKTVVSR